MSSLIISYEFVTQSGYSLPLPSPTVTQLLSRWTPPIFLRLRTLSLLCDLLGLIRATCMIIRWLSAGAWWGSPAGSPLKAVTPPFLTTNRKQFSLSRQSHFSLLVWLFLCKHCSCLEFMVAVALCCPHDGTSHLIPPSSGSGSTMSLEPWRGDLSTLFRAEQPISTYALHLVKS